MPVISAPQVLVDGVLVGPASVVVDGGLVVDVLHRRPGPGRHHVVLDSGILTPGLVDVQVNGAFGVDAVRADAQGWERLCAGLLPTGVTSYCPTFITAPVDELVGGLRRAAAARRDLAGTGARILGVHLEGPFLSPVQPGMHPVESMTEPTPGLVDALLVAGGADLVLTTLAPEVPGGVEAVRRFVEAGVVVSLGHSDATAAVVAQAVDAGASSVTHLFNAQRGLGHREPGVAGHALFEPRLTLGLIADLHHVAASVCGIVFRAAAGRVALVTDAMAAAGMPPGTYQLGGVEVVVDEVEGLPRLVDGTIAGSALTLDRAVRNLVTIGIDPAGVLDAATRVPADLLRRSDLGRITPGSAADLVWWTEEYRPRRVWTDGVEAWSADAAVTASAVS